MSKFKKGNAKMIYRISKMDNTREMLVEWEESLVNLLEMRGISIPCSLKHWNGEVPLVGVSEKGDFWVIKKQPIVVITKED